MGFSLLFAAKAFALVICFIHLIGFIALLILKMKDMEFYYNITFCIS